MARHPDSPVRASREGDPKEGLESFPRADVSVLETAQPKLIDAGRWC